MTRASAANPSLGALVNRSALARYLERSELPLHSLMFLLPALVLFEIGTAIHPSDPIAFRLLQLFFHQLGANGRFVPAMLVVGILLSWHIARRDPWKVNIETLWGMAFESWALSLPLLILGIAFARWNIHLPLRAAQSQWRSDMVLSLGAGVYEEVVFRLILMTSLFVVLSDVLRLKATSSNLLMVASSAILFSLYHYLGAEPFTFKTFVFRAVAGVYFGVLFLTRGFGVTAGCHIAYDILIVALQTWAIR